MTKKIIEMNSDCFFFVEPLKRLPLLFIITISLLITRLSYANNNPSPSSESIKLPFIIDERFETEMDVSNLNGPPEAILLSATRFKQALGQLLATSKMNSLLQKSRQGKISLTEVKKAGLPIHFDAQNLAIKINIPVKYRKTQIADFGAGKKDFSHLTEPDFFSAYFNFRLSKTIDTHNPKATSQDNVPLPLLATVESVQNMGSFVLAGELNYDELAEKKKWVRGPFSLVKDFQSTSMRASLGDLSIVGAGFQSSLPMLGLSMGKVRSIDPFAPLTPSARNEFYLRDDATVEVYVNHRFVRSLELAAGRHELRNLPMDAGRNSVELKIIERNGKISFITIPFFSDFTLLDEGVHDFYYGAGVPRQTIEREIHYDSRHSIGSMYHRYGITNWLTGGLNFQADYRDWLVGVQLGASSPIGFFIIDFAQSKLHDRNRDHAGSLIYRYLFDQSLALRLEVENRGRFFAPVGSDESGNLYAPIGRADVSWSFENSYSLSVGGDYEMSRDKTGDRWVRRVNLFKGFKNNISLSLQYDENKDLATQALEHRFFASIQWVDDDYHNQLLGSYEDRDDSKRADWVYNPGQHPGEAVARASHLTNRDYEESNASLGYSGYRGLLEIEQAYTKPKLEDMKESYRTRVNANTSLVFTKNGYGFSKPISDSFILFSKEGYDPELIDVNPTSEAPQAIIDFWGPAILSEVSSYLPTHSSLQTRDLLSSSLLSHTDFSFYPTYRSGSSVKIKMRNAVIILGKLRSPRFTQEQLSLRTGKLIPLDTKQSAVEFFTNQQGEFYVSSIEPGIYKLVVTGLGEYGYTKVPWLKNQEVNLGEIVLSDNPAPIQ